VELECGKKARQENKTAQNLSQEKRKNETIHARRRNLTELNDNKRDNEKGAFQLDCP
jgi:hypothetical protein